MRIGRSPRIYLQAGVLFGLLLPNHLRSHCIGGGPSLDEAPVKLSRLILGSLYARVAIEASPSSSLNTLGARTL